MALKRILDSLDGIDEATQKLYVKQDNGKFKLDADEEDTTELRTAITNARNESAEEKRKRQAAEALASKYTGLGLSPEELKLLAANHLATEDMKLIAAGKLPEVLEKHTNNMKADYEGRLTAAAAKVTESEARVQKYNARVLENAIRAAATKAGLHAAGVDDALLRGERIFELDENGTAIPKDKQIGKDGKTLMSVDEWLDGMKTKAPHWYPAAASGYGSTQNGNSGGGGKSMTRAEFDKLDGIQRAKVAKERIPIVD